MRRRICSFALGLLLVSLSPAAAAERSSAWALAGVGYGSARFPLQHHDSTFVVYGADGPLFTIGGVLAVPISERWELALRGLVAYRTVSGAYTTTVQDIGAPRPSRVSAFTLALDPTLRLRLGAGYVGLGPTLGSFLARGTLGTGTSAETSSSRHFMSGAVLEGGYRFNAWELFVRTSFSLLLPSERVDEGVALDVTLGIARRL